MSCAKRQVNVFTLFQSGVAYVVKIRWHVLYIFCPLNNLGVGASCDACHIHTFTASQLDAPDAKKFMTVARKRIPQLLSKKTSGPTMCFLFRSLLSYQSVFYNASLFCRELRDGRKPNRGSCYSHGLHYGVPVHADWAQICRDDKHDQRKFEQL